MKKKTDRDAVAGPLPPMVRKFCSWKTIEGSNQAYPFCLKAAPYPATILFERYKFCPHCGMKIRRSGNAKIVTDATGSHYGWKINANDTAQRAGNREEKP